MRRLLMLVLVAMAMLTTASGAWAAGPGGPGGGGGSGGGGGGGGGGETTATNNLSVPTVFIGSAGFGLPAPTAPDTATALVPPSGTPQTGFEVAGYYYVQGVNTWRAQYMVKTMDTATATWGANLTGDASLKSGHPIRVEMGLTSDDVSSMQGYSVIKLQTSLADRNSAYGTKAFPNGDGTYSAQATTMPARVWVAGATLTIIGPTSSSTVALPGEINATGAPVFGYNWRPSDPGQYTLKFSVPTDSVSFSNPANTTLIVNVTSGGGGGGGGGGRGGHGA